MMGVDRGTPDLDPDEKAHEDGDKKEVEMEAEVFER
jgi:hypothetical protein